MHQIVYSKTPAGDTALSGAADFAAALALVDDIDVFLAEYETLIEIDSFKAGLDARGAGVYVEEDSVAKIVNADYFVEGGDETFFMSAGANFKQRLQTEIVQRLNARGYDLDRLIQIKAFGGGEVYRISLAATAQPGSNNLDRNFNLTLRPIEVV